MSVAVPPPPDATWQHSHHEGGPRRIAVVAALVAVDLVSLLQRSEVLDHSPRAPPLLQREGPEGDADVAHFPPVLAPRIAHDPVAAVIVVLAPANNGDHVVDLRGLRPLLDHPALVVQQGFRGDVTGDGAVREDLFHYGRPAADGAVVRDGDVGVRAEASAGAALIFEAPARPRDVEGRAGPIDVRAEAFPC